MPFQLEATHEGSLPEIAAFLRNVYHAPEDAPNLEPDLLAWKYYEAGPEWDGSRSIVLRKGGVIAAHGSIWPVRLATRNGTFRALQVLDWGSSVAGMGAALMNKMRSRADVLITVGGSEDTVRLLPAMGFQVRGKSGVYARVLRPFRQFRTRRFDGLRALPRLLRNIGWSMAPVASVSGWTSDCAFHPDPQLLSRLEAQAPSYPESRHSLAFLEYMLRCPAAAVSYFQLSRGGSPQGYFVLSRVGGQVRLADLRILSEEAADLSAAYATAVSAAARDPQSCEMICYGSVPAVRRALESNGFRSRGDLAVFVLDPGNVLCEPEHLHLGMLDDDSAYLRDPANPYCT